MTILSELKDLGTPVATMSKGEEEELLSLLDELWHHFGRVTLPPIDDQQLSFVASSWLAIVYRQARAVGVLIRQGLTDAGIANARVAFEHAIYPSLMADTRDYQAIFEALEGRSVFIWMLMLKGLPDAPEVFHSLLTEIDNEVDVPPEMAWVRKVEKVCEKLDTGETVYWHYRLLTSQMHPGLASAIPYMLKLPDVPGFDKKPSLLDTRMALSLAVGSCVWAGWSADSIFGAELFGPL